MSNGHSPFYLKIDGSVIRGAMIDNLEINQRLGDHYWCHVDFRLVESDIPPVASWLGKKFEFLTLEDSSEYSVFEGMIWGGEIEYGLHGDYIAKITAVTKSYLLQLTPEEDYFLKKDLRDVTNEIVSEDGLEVSFTASGSFTKMNYVQWGESDFDFIKRIADDEGCAIRPTPTGVEIQRGFTDTGLKLKWHDEYGLIKFSLKGELGQPAYDGTSYDPRTMESRTFSKVKKDPQYFPNTATEMIDAVKSQSQSLPSARMVFDGRAPKLDDYQKALERESQRSIGRKIFGIGVSRNSKLKPGDKVTLEGSGMSFHGDYGVIAVTHRYDLTNGYRNDFTVTPWKEYTNNEQPNPQRMIGVVLGRVVDNNDPRGMGRIRIRYDWMLETPSAWARMTTPSAGGGRGFMFMPEIGDEVLVAFENGDPERPYIIGALWNGVDSAPRQGFWEDQGTVAAGAAGAMIPGDIANNDIKRIVTKGGHRIQMIDVQGKESIVISTPGGQVIQLLDHCPETGGRQMLALTSPGDILLNAPEGRVHIRSKFFSKEVG